jgi:hypothetical protein
VAPGDQTEVVGRRARRDRQVVGIGRRRGGDARRDALGRDRAILLGRGGLLSSGEQERENGGGQHGTSNDRPGACYRRLGREQNGSAAELRLNAALNRRKVGGGMLAIVAPTF